MRQRSLVLVFIVLILAAATTCVSCGRLKNLKGSISGTVYMDGRPIFGHVVVKDANGSIVAQATTNPNGHYIIKDLNPGTYKLMYLNPQGVPWGTEVVVEVHLGKFEVADLQLKSTDRLPLSEYR